eukprot:528213_1
MTSTAPYPPADNPPQPPTDSSDPLCINDLRNRGVITLLGGDSEQQWAILQLVKDRDHPPLLTADGWKRLAVHTTQTDPTYHRNFLSKIYINVNEHALIAFARTAPEEFHAEAEIRTHLQRIVAVGNRPNYDLLLSSTYSPCAACIEELKPMGHGFKSRTILYQKKYKIQSEVEQYFERLQDRDPTTGVSKYPWDIIECPNGQLDTYIQQEGIKTAKVATAKVIAYDNEYYNSHDMQQSGRLQFGHSQFGHSQSGHFQSGHSQFGHSQSGHSQSGHSQFGRLQSGHYQSGHFQSGHSQFGHSQSGHSQSGHSQFGRLQSGHYQSGHFQSGHSQFGRLRSEYPPYEYGYIIIISIRTRTKKIISS